MLLVGSVIVIVITKFHWIVFEKNHRNFESALAMHLWLRTAQSINTILFHMLAAVLSMNCLNAVQNTLYMSVQLFAQAEHYKLQASCISRYSTTSTADGKLDEFQNWIKNRMMLVDAIHDDLIERGIL